MQRIFLLILVVCSFCTVSKAQGLLSTESFYGDKHYQSSVTLELLEGSPAWPEEQDNPPLPPRRAVEIALGHLQKLFSNAEKWRKGEIRLYPVREKWVYIIELIGPPLEDPKSMSGINPHFAVIVLMSGEPVEPKVTPRKSS
jgi:hypothetical protein